VAEATQRVLSCSSNWEGGRAMRRQKAASNDQAGGESSPLPINSEGETSFAEIALSMSAKPVLPNQWVATHWWVAKLFQVGREAFLNVTVFY